MAQFIYKNVMKLSVLLKKIINWHVHDVVTSFYPYLKDIYERMIAEGLPINQLQSIYKTFDDLKKY